MTWKSRYRTKESEKLPKAVPVSSIDEIPDEAAEDQAFRLAVEVLRITERSTSTGEPCYFLSLQDGDGERFSVVAWASQWAKLEGKVVEGGSATLELRVPVDGYASFTLAL
jgi:DNA polymerase III alpha subunit